MDSQRVVLLSDTHGFLDPRIAAAVGDSDVAVHAGDICGAQVLAGLRPRGGRVVAVRGNNDVPAKWAPEQGTMLEELPDELLLSLPGGELMVVHGHQIGSAARRHAGLRARYPAVRAIVYGHSHRLVIDQGARPWVLNPGAAGRTRTFGGPSCLILHAGVTQWRIESLRFAPL